MLDEPEELDMAIEPAEQSFGPPLSMPLKVR